MKNKSIVSITLIIIVAIILFLYALTIIFTLSWGLLTSFKSDIDFSLARNMLGLPSSEFSHDEIRFRNYSLVFENFTALFKNMKKGFYSGDEIIVHVRTHNILSVIWNTVIYAGVGSIIHAFVPFVVAFLVAKYPGRFSKLIYVVALVVLTIPIVGAYPSEIALLRRLRLYDNWFGYFLQKFNFTGIYFFVFYAFFQSLSDSYTEAAEIDGASQWKILINIIIPLTSKIIGAIILLNFVQLWNDFQTPLLYYPTLPTLAYGVYSVYKNPAGELATTPIKVAGCMMLAVPILIIFIFLKDKLMGNVSMGGLKE